MIGLLYNRTKEFGSVNHLLPGDLAASAVLGRVSTIDALVAAISQMMFDGEAKPGDQLREQDLAERFSVARHSVRSALQTLAQNGLAVHELNRGVFVRSFTAEAIKDMYQLRLALETEAVRHVHEHDLARGFVDDALAAMEGMPTQADVGEVVLADLRFHRAIVATTESARMEQAFDSVDRELRLAMAQAQFAVDTPLAMAREHRELADVIWGSSPRRAEAAIREHLMRAISDVQAAL